jgi:hypothetical protein
MTLGVQQCPGEEYVFSGAEQGRPLSQKVMERHIAAIANRSGIQKTVTCRILRHSCAVECLRAGMTIEQLRHNLGHAHIRSTMIYQQCILPAGVVSPTDKLHLSEPVPTDTNPESHVPDLASRLFTPPSYLPFLISETIFTPIERGSREKHRYRNG